MISNIRHSNPRVLEALCNQMEKTTFAYWLHFENNSAKSLARRLVEYLTSLIVK